MRFLIEHPWIVIVALSVLFYISVGILYYKNTKRRKAFNTIKSMKRDKELSKVYLESITGMVNSMICHFQLMEITGHLEFYFQMSF